MCFLFKKNKIIAFLLTSVLTLSYTTPAFSDTTEENINSNKVKYEELNNQTKELNSKIATLDNQIEELNSRLTENNTKIDETKVKIENTEQLIATNKEDLEKSKNKLSGRIRSAYKSDANSNILLLLLSSKSFSDLFTKMDAVNQVVKIDKSIIDEIKSKQNDLDSTVSDLNQEQSNLQNLSKNIKDSKSQIEAMKNEQQSFLSQINAQKDEIFAVIESNEKTLIARPVGIINSSNAKNELSEAISTLKSLIPQLNSDTVKKLAEDSINSGNNKISQIEADEAAKAAEEAAKEAAANAPKPQEPTAPAGSANVGAGKATLTMEATAYTGGTFTAMGLKPVRDPNGISTIAVDPSVIPLGSKVMVAGYGVAIASDTGGAIKGHIIDVYLNSNAECIQWGRRSVSVTILAYPGEW